MPNRKLSFGKGEEYSLERRHSADDQVPKSGSYLNVPRNTSPANLSRRNSWALLKNIIKVTDRSRRGDQNDNGRPRSPMPLHKQSRSLLSVSSQDNSSSELLHISPPPSPIPGSHDLSRRQSLGHIPTDHGRSPSPRLNFRRMSISSTPSGSTDKVNRKHDNDLQEAVSGNNHREASKLLEAGKVDINYMQPPGVSALHQACVLGNMKMVRLLVEHGADVNLMTWSTLSPVQIATSFGHFEVASHLIQNGADPALIQDGCNNWSASDEPKHSRSSSYS